LIWVHVLVKIEFELVLKVDLKIEKSEFL